MKTNIKSMSTTAHVLYPIFAQCAKYTLDPFWKEIFMNYSMGKFPKNVKYDGDKHSLHIKLQKNTNWEIFVLPKDEIALYKFLKLHMQKNLNIYSTRDIQARTNAPNVSNPQEKVECWKQIRSKNQKDILIINYVIAMRKLYKLSQSEYKQLFSLINLGIQIKSISSDDIKYNPSEKKIENIENISFDAKKRRFKLENISELPVKIDIVSPSNKLYQDIDKFIARYKKMETF